MKTVEDVIKNILLEECEVLADGKMDAIAKRIVKELGVENHKILTDEELQKAPGVFYNPHG